MADDISYPFPGEAVLTERARKAGIDLEALGELARLRLLREFRTSAEKEMIEAKSRGEIAEDIRRYNAYFDKYGIWNAKLRGW